MLWYTVGQVVLTFLGKSLKIKIQSSTLLKFGLADIMHLDVGRVGGLPSVYFLFWLSISFFFLKNHASLLSQQCCLNGIGCIPLITRVGTWYRCGQSIPLHAPCCLAQQWRNDWVLRLLELLEEKHPEPVKYSVQTGSLSVPTNRISREKCRLPAYILASLFLLLDCPLSEILPVFKFKLNHWYLLLQEL